MFLLTRQPERGRAVLARLLDGLPDDAPEIHATPVGEHTLLWSGVQVTQNLHVFADGVLLGRRRAAEPWSSAPIVHDEPLPATFAPLLRGTVIRSGGRLEVEPLGVTSVFRAGDDVSDRQLLLAGLRRLRPSAEGVALLSGVGYLPGNETSFREVTRVPFAHRLDVERGTTALVRPLTLPKPDDAALLERMVSIVPPDVPHALAMSGGFDSRFVLAVLTAAKADVRIVRFDDAETEIVRQIAEQLDIEVQHAGTFTDRDQLRTPAQFVLMADGQMPFGASQNGAMRVHLTPEDCFHSGQFSDSIIKNAFKSAWKVPRPDRPYWPHLLEYSLLPGVPAEQPGLRALGRREEVTELVTRAVAYQREYIDFPKRKQWASWVYYLNRGMRWAQAYYDDLTFSTDPVFLLSDPTAQLLGIASGFWPNFHNDRTRELTCALVPDLDVPYADGSGARPTPRYRRWFDKLEYEYVYRLRQRKEGLARIARNKRTFETVTPDDEPAGWDDLYRVPMAEATTAGGFRARRAAITTAHVLAFLESLDA